MKQHYELIAAEPVDEIDMAYGCLQKLGKKMNDLVAHIVAESVINRFEIVDIDHHAGQIKIVVDSLVKHFDDPLVEMTPVVQPR